MKTSKKKAYSRKKIEGYNDVVKKIKINLNFNNQNYYHQF